MNTEDFTQILQRLNAISYGANLPAGKIYWTNKAGEVVAHAETKAILSWAATNNSAMWAYAIGQFEDAGVPVLKPSFSKGDYFSNITDEQAADFAAQAAEEAQATYLYRASNGANGLYLAIYNFKEEAIELSSEDLKRKRRSTISYQAMMLSNLAEILSNRKRTEEAIKLMQHYHNAIEEQLEQIIKEDDELREAFLKQQKSLKVWESMLPKQRRDVLAFIKQAASKWSRMK